MSAFSQASPELTAEMSQQQLVDLRRSGGAPSNRIPEEKASQTDAGTAGQSALKPPHTVQELPPLTSVDANSPSGPILLPAASAENSPSTPAIGTAAIPVTLGTILGWQDDVLKTVEKQLATFVGSLARILVKKTASKTGDLEKLYTLLAASLERENDRRAFLALKSEVAKSWPPKAEPIQAPLPPVPANAPPTSATQAALTPASIDQAARLLARHVGPIAGVLAKRAASRADSPRAFYQLLSEHIENKTERDRFLRNAGVAA
jgi:serine/threonine-protein kinase